MTSIRTETDQAARMGGRILADALAGHGVTHAFAVPGESYLALLDGLVDVADRVRLVTCRFEAGAVNMAEAYAKLTGRVGVALVTRGPGACHGSIGALIAAEDSTPLVLMIGQVARGMEGREAFQEVDYRQMFGGIAKWVVQIEDASRIPEQIGAAFQIAASGRPGPVVVALPEDMQHDLALVPDAVPMPVPRAFPDPAAMARLSEMLDLSERPLLLLGGSPWSDRGRADLARFAEAWDLPVAVGFRRQSLFDGWSERYVGDIGVGSDPALIARAREADLLVVVGSRLSEATSQGYSLLGVPNPGVALVQVSNDPATLGRVHRAALPILADPDAFAAAASVLRPGRAPRWRAWRQGLREAREAQRMPPPVAHPLDMGRVMRELEELAEPDAVFTTDAGNFATWPQRFLNFRGTQRFVGPCNGAMGYSVPAGVAASILYPGRQVVSFVGDGGFLMTGQEVATAVHEGASPIVLVFNNSMYGTIRMHQEREHPGRVSGTGLTNPDFARLVLAYGGHGEVVTRTEEFAPAFRRAAASGKVAVIELRTDPEQITSRTTITALRARKK